MSTDQRIQFGPGLKYTWRGNFGCWFKSNEVVPVGEVRCVEGELFHAWQVMKRSWFETTFLEGRTETWWVPVSDKRDMADIHAFARKVLGI